MSLKTITTCCATLLLISTALNAQSVTPKQLSPDHPVSELVALLKQDQSQHFRTNSDSSEQRLPWINEYSLSINHNDIATYSSHNNKLGYGLGVYHNGKVYRGFSGNTGVELNITRFIGNVIPYNTLTPVSYSSSAVDLYAVTLPANFRYQIGRNVKLFADFGLYGEIVMLARTKITRVTYSGQYPNITRKDEEVQINADIQHNNLGINTGLGLMVPIGRNHLNLKIEYRYGCFDLTPKSGSMDMYNRYIRFSAGYLVKSVKGVPSSSRLRIANEFRISTNYNYPTYNDYNRTKPSNHDNRNNMGYGIGIYRTSKEWKHLQHVVGMELDLVKHTYSGSYHHTYNGLNKQTTMTSKEKQLIWTISNALRFHVGDKMVRPFIQAGLSPQFNVMLDKRYTIVEEDFKTNSREEFQDRYKVFKIWDVMLSPEIGVGTIIKADKVNYLLLVNYTDGRILEDQSWKNRTAYARLSLGIQLK